MDYVSTRGAAPTLGFADALLAGLARDGGLYVPLSVPRWEPDAIRTLRGVPYPEAAARIMAPFVDGDFNPGEIKSISEAAYAGFRHAATAPLRQIDGNLFALEDLGLLVSPLILTGLAAAVTLRIGLWNIGGEGQFYAGAIAATVIGINVQGNPGIMLVVLAAAGFIGGALWILIPALARAYLAVDEIITTLLLNFVALLLVNYLSTGVLRDPSQAEKYLKMGVKHFCIGWDVRILADWWDTKGAEMRGMLGDKSVTPLKVAAKTGNY